jgi:hypothetical protein
MELNNSLLIVGNPGEILEIHLLNIVFILMNYFKSFIIQILNDYKI